MQIDPRLNAIDDCLYRVALRALIVQNDRILLVHEIPEGWWAFPGGGVEHGEAIDSCLRREVEEELGVPSKDVATDNHIAYFNIGAVVNSIPRVNIFYRASVPERLLEATAHVANWGWFAEDEFLELPLNPSYDKATLVDVIFAR